MIAKNHITGLVLAGGRGSRMGGVDKGLQTLDGLPLALHALRRLAPQVGSVRINANRNLAAYEALGVPVWSDPDGDYAGPLAGIATGLERCSTPYLVTVPCDTPDFPANLVHRLAQALPAADAAIAVAHTREDGRLRAQPVFCLLRRELLDHLRAYLSTGGRKVADWFDQHRSIAVAFEEAQAFSGANTLEELRRLAAAAGSDR